MPTVTYILLWVRVEVARFEGLRYRNAVWLVNEGGIDPARLISVLHYDGTPITARFIIRDIAERLESLNLAPRMKVVS